MEFIICRGGGYGTRINPIGRPHYSFLEVMAMTQQETDTLLGGYRVLDLTEWGCMVGGKMMADLGADVIKIEPPGGSPSRRIGPFYKDIPDPDKSLVWFAYNTNKRSITMDITKRDGQELFKRLVKSADFVLENFPVGYMASLGLGYEDLEKINPAIIVASITPYGQTGPKAHYKAYDLTIWASGIVMWLAGDTDRAPVWISGSPQATLHGGAEAAASSMVAHWYRQRTGIGQHVDVSMQECAVWTTMDTTGYWTCHQFEVRRLGMLSGRGTPYTRAVFPCKEGFVTTSPDGGASRAARDWPKWIRFMDQEGVSPPDWFRNFDFARDYDRNVRSEETVAKVEGAMGDFFQTKTKHELFDFANKNLISLVPVSSAKDVVEADHFKAREYWTQVEYPELGDTLTHCGAPVKLSEAPWKIRRRAPVVGEDNEQVYLRELGLSPQEYMLMRRATVI